MVSTGLSKAITQPLAGLTLLSLIAIAYPYPSQAQQPTLNAPTLPTQTGAPIQQQPDVPYTLGGGDRIRINVFEVPEYSGDYQVPPGGTLYLPLIGGLSVQGLSQEQAAETIASKYSRFLKRPIVTVSLIAPRPINVVVSGEVNRPGSYTVGLLAGGGDNPGVQYPTVIGAITLAQGVTLSADLRNVQLRRPQGLGSQQTSTLDLTELIQTGNAGRDLTLRDGDTIFIPTASDTNLAEIRQFATASFAAPENRPRTVTVVGEVNRPGSYVVVGGSAASSEGNNNNNNNNNGAQNGLPTVTRAIQLAGGITSEANVRNIQVRRPTKNGLQKSINVDFWKLLRTGDVNQDTLIQDGDTILVPTVTDANAAEVTELADANFSPNTIQVSVVGEVKRPGVVDIPPNTPLNQAVMTAGGFSDGRARRSSVDLIRLNPDGSVTKRKVPIDMAQGINEEGNPSLRDNDIVVVNRNGAARIGDTLDTLLSPAARALSFLRIFTLF